MGQWGLRRHVREGYRSSVAMFAAIAAFAGCGVGAAGCGGGADTASTVGEEVTIPRPASVLLQVADVEGAPIPLAVVTVAAQGSFQTADGAGRLLLEGLPTGRFVARVEAKGFAPASVVVELPEGAHAGHEVRLHPLGEPIAFDADAGGMVEKGGVRVVIPPASLVTEDGEYVTGMVEATVVRLDPTSRPVFLPGPLEGASRAGGEEVGLESAFMAEVSLWKGNRRLKLAPGTKATLAFPLPDALVTKYAAGDVVEAWWLDLDAGRFREEGAGVVQPSDTEPGKLVWVVEVEHFTWWNWDAWWTDKNCFHVFVMDPNGMPVGNANLSATGVSYEGSSLPRITSADGDACIDIKLGGTANIIVNDGVSPIVTAPVTGSGPASACSGLGAACVPLHVTVGSAICVPGSHKECSYSGPAATKNVGACKADRSYCNATGTAWLACAGMVTPSAETCSTPYDDDCDGVIPPLSDNDACTADICEPSGNVSHQPVNVSDNNACTVDACNSVNGISHISVEASDIDDSNACTIDACNSVIGVIHALISVDDGDPCTEDECDSMSGVSHTYICSNDPCLNAPLNDKNACTIDACDPATGVVSHTAISPDDGDACTLDSCHPLSGISNIPVSTDDGNACTVDSCDPATGQSSHTPIAGLNDNNVCTVDTCDPATGNIAHTPLASINDNNMCTTDTCNPANGLISHTQISINDNDPCTIDTCNAQTGPAHTSVNINDNNACTNDACNPANGAITHTLLPQINDNNACTDDLCDSATGNITHPPVNVNDNNACTVDACLPASGPTHTPIDPSDGNACTQDTCEPAIGPVYTNLDFNDNNACTTDTCNPAIGVIHTPIDPNDGNGCTLDNCDPMTGVSNMPVNINDNDVCTTDSCNPASGVISHTQVSINDNNACTVDTCDKVTGVSHTPVNINDSSACTNDSCNTSTGAISHTPLPMVDDNNVCTDDACDPLNGAITHTTVQGIDDNNACTTDSCNPQTGISHTPAVLCIMQPDAVDCGLNVCDPASGTCEYQANLFLDDFADLSKGWMLGTEWQIGTAQASSGQSMGNPDPANGYTMFGADNGVAGVKIGGNAATAPHAASYYITSPVVDLSSLPASETVFLHFQRWLNTAGSPQMQNTVEVFNGTTWVTVWQSNAAILDNSWVPQNFDVSSHKNQFFRVRFGFSIGNGAPTMSSWNIDHVRLGRKAGPLCQ